jgi:type IV secretory pathway VirB4 component
MKMCDRFRNIPVRIDLQAAAYQAGLIDNYNAFILGGSGTGKSFFTNYFVRSCYDAGQTVFIIDVGDSY